MRHGDAGRSQAAGGRGDSRHQAEGDAGCGERERLLAAAAEDEGIAPLEAQHAKPLPGEPYQAPADVGLVRRRLAAPLAGIFERSTRPGERQDFRRDQGVVDHAIGLAERIRRVEREQPRIARPGAHEPHRSRLDRGQGWQAGGRRRVVHHRTLHRLTRISHHGHGLRGAVRPSE